MDKFTIGQRVRIRSWEDMEKEYGSDKLNYINPIIFGGSTSGFLSNMQNLCGEEIVILEVDVHGDTFYSGRYIAPWMCEPVEPILPQGKDDKSELFHEDGKTKEDTLEKILEKTYKLIPNIIIAFSINDNGRWACSSMSFHGGFMRGGEFAQGTTHIEALLALEKKLSNNK